MKEQVEKHQETVRVGWSELPFYGASSKLSIGVAIEAEVTYSINNNEPTVHFVKPYADVMLSIAKPVGTIKTEVGEKNIYYDAKNDRKDAMYIKLAPEEVENLQLLLEKSSEMPYDDLKAFANDVGLAKTTTWEKGEKTSASFFRPNSTLEFTIYPTKNSPLAGVGIVLYPKNEAGKTVHDQAYKFAVGSIATKNRLAKRLEALSEKADNISSNFLTQAERTELIEKAKNVFLSKFAQKQAVAQAFEGGPEGPEEAEHYHTANDFEAEFMPEHSQEDEAVPSAPTKTEASKPIFKKEPEQPEQSEKKSFYSGFKGYKK